MAMEIGTLAEFEITYAPIIVREKIIFQVRGLDLEDITFLVTNYLQDIQRAVALYGRDSRRVVERANLSDFVLLIAKDFPSLVAEIISRGCGEPDMTEKARSLPWAVQILALKEILRLSTEEAGGLKNLLAVLAAAMKIDQQMIGSLTTRLQNIIGGSEKMSASSDETATGSQPATL